MAYITYSVVNGMALERGKCPKGLPYRCVKFPDWETRNAAWIADATYAQAIAAFRGTEV